MKPTERSLAVVAVAPLNNSFGSAGLSLASPGFVAYTVNSPSRYSGMSSVVVVRNAMSNPSMLSDSRARPSLFRSRSNIEK